MSKRLTEEQRAQLIDIQSQLARVSGFLQEMTGTVHGFSWMVEDALWENAAPEKSDLRRETGFHTDDIQELLEHTAELLAAVEGYFDEDEHQRALNALANAGMLAPQQQPGPLSPQSCGGRGCGYRYCFGPCGSGKAELPHGWATAEP